MHPRKRLQGIIDECQQMINDALSWNDSRPEEPPLDCEQEQVMLAMAKDAAPLVRWKYLNSESDLTSYNRGAGCWSYRWEVTPIGDFGVQVCTEQSDGDLVYWCEPVADSKAKYEDGTLRPWQEPGWRARYVARPDVLRVAESG